MIQQKIYYSQSIPNHIDMPQLNLQNRVQMITGFPSKILQKNLSLKMNSKMNCSCQSNNKNIRECCQNKKKLKLESEKVVVVEPAQKEVAEEMEKQQEEYEKLTKVVLQEGKVSYGGESVKSTGGSRCLKECKFESINRSNLYSHRRLDEKCLFNTT